MGFTRRFIAILLVCLLPPSASALEVQINISTPFVYIQVGHGLFRRFGLSGPPVGLVDEVEFTLPAGVVPGTGTPVTGAPEIPIALLGYSGGGQARFTVTMNSSVALNDGGGNTIPFNEISWSTRDGDIPDGRFDGSAAQTLLTFDRSWPRGRGVVDFLTFSYDNDTVYAAGTYTGRVVYTIALF